MKVPFRAAIPAILLIAVFPHCGWAAGPDEAERDPVLPPSLAPDAPTKPGKLQTLTQEEFLGVTSIALSPDGKHAYAAAFKGALVCELGRNVASGRLAFRRSFTGENYQGAVALRLSHDGKMAALSSFGSNSVSLFSRNEESGELTETDHAGGDRPVRGLTFCIDNVFSPDGDFLYTVGANSIGVFKIGDGKLTQVEAVTDPPGDPEAVPPMSNGRGIAISPDGRCLYTSWNESGTVMTHVRDGTTGKLTHLQSLRNGGLIKTGLAGVMQVTLSPKGDFAYTAAGRFGGDNAVCVFAIDPGTGELHPRQELTGKDLPKDFDGGNGIMVSPDGLQVAVACTLSDCLTRFSRDPENGRLKAIDSFECGPPAKPGACNVTYDATGRFLLVADEDSKSVVSFRNATR